MTIKLRRHNQEFIVTADSEQEFARKIASLPAGEYTIVSRTGSHGRKTSGVRAMDIVNLVLEIIAILIALACIIPLWLIGCKLI